MASWLGMTYFKKSMDTRPPGCVCHMHHGVCVHMSLSIHAVHQKTHISQKWLVASRQAPSKMCTSVWFFVFKNVVRTQDISIPHISLLLLGQIPPTLRGRHWPATRPMSCMALWLQPNAFLNSAAYVYYVCVLLCVPCGLIVQSWAQRCTCTFWFVNLKLPADTDWPSCFASLEFLKVEKFVKLWRTGPIIQVVVLVSVCFILLNVSLSQSKGILSSLQLYLKFFFGPRFYHPAFSLVFEVHFFLQ